MASGRRLYRSVAEAAVANSRRLYRDAKKLKLTGSRGHSCSFAILSIEESAKALVYYTAAEGVYRIVKTKPNYITTFRKKDLMDHQFKHGIIAAFLSDWLFYLPFYHVMGEARKKTFSKEEVEALLNRAIHLHRRHRMEISSGGRATRDMTRMFSLLEQLNELKNLGLYVDHTDSRVLCPNDISKKEADEVFDLAEMIVEMVTEIVKTPISEEQREMLVTEARKAAEQLRSLRKQAENRE